MIPKKIHYCWFGGAEKPKTAKKCIASWKKHCPDYEIVEWNETTFDIARYPYAKWCFDNRKYAFLSDFVRLIAVSEQGGIYFDTDVEVIKPLDPLLSLNAFYGFENDDYVNTGHGFGAQAGHPTTVAMANCYLSLTQNEKGEFPIVACPQYNTDALLAYGLVKNGQAQTVAGAQIFPKDYFNPFDDPTGRLEKTENTYSIHWYSKSWYSKKMVLRSKLTRPFHRLFGKDCFRRKSK